ncbi:MAG: hypothetical protein WD317_10440 [Balneolaceae bacterium]
MEKDYSAGASGVGMGQKKLETELTLREGHVMWDLNGIASPRWRGVQQATR